MKKIPATAMYYALFLSVIFAILLGGLVLFSGFNQNFALQMDIEEALLDNANSGLAYGQAYFKELPENEIVEMRLFGNGVDSIELQKKQWGVFTIIESKAIHKNRNFTKRALFGGTNKIDQPNLYVVDNGRPISLCGDTRIEGNCFLPKSGLKRAYIEGKNYQGTQLIYGKVNESGKQLPPFNENVIESLSAQGGIWQEWDNSVDSVMNSFSEIAIHIVSDAVVNLSGKVIKGQVILDVKDSIFVGRDSQIENAILKSKVVYIESGFTGTIQVFASNKIILENRVLLKYPSVLGISETEFPDESSVLIEIGEESQVIGTVFLVSTKPNFRMLPTLSIAKGAELDGFVYCAGKTQLRGTVNGSLFTEKLYLKTASSAYENHLLDAQILNQLPSNFISANLLEETTVLKRISWLN